MSELITRLGSSDVIEEILKGDTDVELLTPLEIFDTQDDEDNGENLVNYEIPPEINLQESHETDIIKQEETHGQSNTSQHQGHQRQENIFTGGPQRAHGSEREDHR